MNDGWPIGVVTQPPVRGATVLWRMQDELRVTAVAKVAFDREGRVQPPSAFRGPDLAPLLARAEVLSDPATEQAAWCEGRTWPQAGPVDAVVVDPTLPEAFQRAPVERRLPELVPGQPVPGGPLLAAHQITARLVSGASVHILELRCDTVLLLAGGGLEVLWRGHAPVPHPIVSARVELRFHEGAGPARLHPKEGLRPTEISPATLGGTSFEPPTFGGTDLSPPTFTPGRFGQDD